MFLCSLHGDISILNRFKTLILMVYREKKNILFMTVSFVLMLVFCKLLTHKIWKPLFLDKMSKLVVSTGNLNKIQACRITILFKK